MAKTTDMTSKDVTDALFRYFNAYRGYKYQLVNAFVFKWESDFFCLAGSGYSYEVEVKVSRADFFADFEKEEKHRILQHSKMFPMKVGHGYTAFQVYPGTAATKKVLYAPYRSNGHPKHFDKDPLYINVKWIDPCTAAPNRFLYAVPDGLVKVREVPDYAGLIYVLPDRRRKPKIVKKPPAIHSHKKDFTGILLEKYYWGYLSKLGQSKAGKNFRLPGEPQPMKRTR